MLGGVATPIDATRDAMDGFGPLKAVLGDISAVYDNYEVRSRPPTQNSSLTNQSAAIGNKIGVLLSHLAALEAGFATCPGDGNVAELRRRRELIRYAIFSLETQL